MSKRALRLLITAFASVPLLINGCGKSLYGTAEIKPGEADYPVENRDPNHFVQLTVAVPSNFSTEASATFVASDPGGTLASGTSCQREVGLAVAAPFYLGVPVALTRDGDIYHGTLTVDQYAPGRCKWKFRGLGFQLLRKGETSRSPSAVSTYPQSDSPLIPSAQHSDEWCANLFCTNLAILLSDGKIGADFVAAVPADRRGTGNPVFIGPKTTSLSVEFHDLDAVDPQTRMSGEADPDAFKKTPEYRALLCFQHANLEYGQTHQPLPDTQTQTADLNTLKNRCRAEVGLPPQ